MSKKRVDMILFERGLAESRSKAQALVMAGQVYRGDQRIDKAGTQLPDDVELEVRATRRFVSRGGDKLDHALDALNLDPAGFVCLDVGASTGGFTDCLLSRGATKVYAVDVGYGQLHPRLRDDPRVVVRERTNARGLQPADFDEALDLVVVDASFISISKLVAPIAALLAPQQRLVAMIKPQFEVGKEVASKSRGVIRDEHVRAAAIDQAKRAIVEAGFTIERGVDSAVRGPKGNVEHFVCALRAS